MFDEPVKLVLGLVTGILFGILLQKGQVAKYDKIIGQFLLKDFTVVKIMATAVAVGSVGVNALVAMGWATLHIQTASLARILVGGVLFGTGMAVFGLCPGTSVAACGEGRRDAMIGVVGMLMGTAVYVTAYPLLEPFFASLADFGKVTLPQFTNSPTLFWVLGLALVFAAGLAILERFHPRKLDTSIPPPSTP